MKPRVIVSDARVDMRKVDRVTRALLDQPDPVKCGIPAPIAGFTFCQAPYGHRGLLSVSTQT